MDSAGTNRLARERVWRNVGCYHPGCSACLFPRHQREKEAPLAGRRALVYMLVFNFRYAVLDGRTYSLSSVDSQTLAFTYTAGHRFYRGSFGWLVSMLRLRAFQAGLRKAAETSLGFVFFTIYLRRCPFGQFRSHGILVTWTLPEFYTSYIALLSLIQWIFVAAFGLLLSGAAALIAHYIHEPVIEHKKYRRKYVH